MLHARPRCTIVLGVVLGAVLAGAPAAGAAGGTQVFTRTITPNPTTTKGFDGFETVRVRAPGGAAIVSGAARIVGGDRGSVVIKQSFVDPAHERFVVRLEFPGEQGVNGKLRVRVVTRPRGRRTERTYELHATSTRGFNGFETILVHAPGRRPLVSAAARIVGGDAGSVRILKTTYANHRRTYVVRVIFPGTQGIPGRLRVSLVT
jgi:hypothetical protein